MPKLSALVHKGRKALKDLNLPKVLHSEIQHELSSDRFQKGRSGSLGDFAVEWDAPQSQDVVLRRKCETGEEVAVSALLGPFSSDTSERPDSVYPRNVAMKVCVKKPGLSSMLQFDCGIYEVDSLGSGLHIQNVYYLPSSAGIGPSVYRGPSFRTLDPRLQDALGEYLVAKGIGESLTNFLLHHLHKKEQGQYVNWLQKLESFVTK